jgi:hypothetical protein
MIDLRVDFKILRWTSGVRSTHLGVHSNALLNLIAVDNLIMTNRATPPISVGFLAI